MTELTISCPLAALGGTWANRKDNYELLYKELTKVLDEDKVLGIQLFPAGWPRKLQLTFKDLDVKDEILVEGLDIFNKHVEWQDENNILTKVVLRDAPVEFTEGMIRDEMDKYGKIMIVEREMVRADGRDTQWTNGTWHVFIATVYMNIRGKIAMEKYNKSFTISAWHKGQANISNDDDYNQTNCIKCGESGHYFKNCPHETSVSF